MSLESTLSGWTGPSSDTEQDRQARTERMVREAVRNHVPLASCRLTIYAKGSYANNTNVRTDSDVDIAVQCHEAEYWEEATPGAHTPGAAYAGIWTPAKLRAEVGASLRSYFAGQVDYSGSTAIGVRSSSARVDADVVPCFDYRYYSVSGASHVGTRVFRKNGSHFENFPTQQLVNGTRKNTRTNTIYKKSVRVLKRVENAMVANRILRAVPSFFIESLVYNCPDSILGRSSWTDRVKGILVHIWNELEGEEPSEASARWLEVNEWKYLFHANQKWTRADVETSQAAWNSLGYTS